jgi:hypothetical protein
MVRLVQILVLLLTAVECPAAVYVADRVSGSMAIDGTIAEDEWRGITPIELRFETSPGHNTPAPVRTLAFLGFDTSTLYVAFRAWDPDIRSLRATMTDRDPGFDDDLVGIVLDTFNDRRRAVQFYANPFGVQTDGTNLDTEGEDQSWDAIWQSAGRVHADRWEVEMAIPFSALRFRAGDRTRIWGLDLVRLYPRDRNVRIGLHPIDAARSCYVCQLSELTGLQGIRAGSSVELAPTVTASQTDQRFRQGSIEADPGLTARWGITPSLTTSFAFNPDFSQVEADAPQLDVNEAFTLSFAEKRPFFLEGTDFFQTPLIAVYTRTVADPAWGVKLTGTRGRNGVGTFVAEDELTGLIIPGPDRSSQITLPGKSHAAVLRYRYDLGSGSSLGFLGSSRRGDSYANDVAGFDAFFQPGKADFISAQVLMSRTEYPDEVARAMDQPGGAFEGRAAYLRYEHRTRTWYWTASYDDTSVDFRADAGFIPQVGYRHADAGMQRTWWRQQNFLSRVEAGMEWDVAKRQDGSLLEEEIEGWVKLSGPWQSEVQMVVGERRRGFLSRQFDPEQTFDLAAEIAPHRRFQAELTLNAGDTIDFANARPARRLRIAPALRVRATRGLVIDLAWSQERLDVAGGRLFDASAGELKAVYQFNLRTFVRLGAQHTEVRRNPSLYGVPVQSRSRRLLPQFLFSYKINPRTVLFAGYSGTHLDDDRTIDLQEQNRTFFLKIGYAWLL